MQPSHDDRNVDERSKRKKENNKTGDDNNNNNISGLYDHHQHCTKAKMYTESKTIQEYKCSTSTQF